MDLIEGTEEVILKKYGVLLDSHLNKDFYEYLCLLVLKRFYKEDFKDLEKPIHDIPDLKSGSKKWGIEVTYATSENMAKIEGEFIKYRKGCKKSKSKIEQLGGKVEQIGITNAELSISYPLTNSTEEKAIIKKVFEKKVKKIKDYQKDGFQNLGVAILHPDILIPFDNFQDYYQKLFLDIQNKLNSFYHSVFLISSQAVIRFDFIPKMNVKTILIERNEYRTITILALQLAQNLIKIEDIKITK